jgi:hypothetical protein
LSGNAFTQTLTLFLKFGRIFVLLGQNNWELFGLFGCKFCNFFWKNPSPNFKNHKIGKKKKKIEKEKKKTPSAAKKNHQHFFFMKIIEQKKK